MLHHALYRDSEQRMHLNASIQHLKQFFQDITTMYRLENYTDFFRRLNITDEDIDYVNNFAFDNLTLVQKTTVPQSTASCYCNGAVRNLAIQYKSYHGYVSLIVCLFGTLANMLNIIVLTRKDMAAAPINRILTALATTDMLVMLEYIPFSIYMYIVLPERQTFPYGWALYVLVHMHFTQLLHTTSIAITLTLAVWRYIAIRFPQHTHAWCTASKCRLALWCSVLAPVLTCTPSYFVFGIKEKFVNDNGTLEVVYYVDADYSGEQGYLYQSNFWVLAVVVKILPCIILTVISCWLIQALYRVKGRKLALKGYNKCASTAEAASTIGNGLLAPKRASKSERRADRTTRMLVAVLLLFLVTEIPQGVLGLLSGVLGDCFFRNCYHNFGEIMDILALLNGAINFILYCSMSRQFRTTFGEVFKPKIMKNWHPATQQTEVQSTYV